MDCSDWMPADVMGTYACRLSPSLRVLSPSKYLFAILSVTGSLTINPWTLPPIFVWNAVAVLSFLRSMLFLLPHSTAVKHEMTAGSLCCFFLLCLCSFRRMARSCYAKMILCEMGSTHEMWALTSKWPVLRCTPWITDILTIMSFFLLFPPPSLHPFFIFLLFPLFLQHLSFWLFFFLCLLHSHATLFQWPLPRWFISFFLSDVLNDAASKATSKASPQEQHRRARYVCFCVLPSLISHQDSRIQILLLCSKV